MNVLECKGTQQSRKALHTLIESGVQQKSNLKTRAGSGVHHSLVVGLFVPQFSNQEEALLHVRDPKLPLVEDTLKRITVAQQTIGITQIALAQHFGLMGLQSMANALANRAVLENEPLQLAHGLEAEAVQSGQDPTYTFRFSLPLPTGAMTLNDREVSTINFEMSCFKDLYTELISSTDLNTTLLKLANAAYQSKWASKGTKDTATLTSPLGVFFESKLRIVDTSLEPVEPSIAVAGTRASTLLAIGPPGGMVLVVCALGYPTTSDPRLSA